MACLSLSVFVGCVDNSVKYVDGQFIGKSQTIYLDEQGTEKFYGIIELYITNGKVDTCVYNICESDGTLVGEMTVGKYAPSTRDKVVKALRASKTYASNFVKHQGLGGWDKISDDPFAYELFKGAFDDASKDAVAK